LRPKSLIAFTLSTSSIAIGGIIHHPIGFRSLSDLCPEDPLPVSINTWAAQVSGEYISVGSVTTFTTGFLPRNSANEFFVGIRYTGVRIPRGAVITGALITFQEHPLNLSPSQSLSCFFSTHYLTPFR
jgi:hypothetical protein